MSGIPDFEKITKEEVLEPLIFPKRQRAFRLFTAAFSSAVVLYFVFGHDFGEKEHVFSGIRRFVERRKQQFFQLSPDELKLLQNENQNSAGSSESST